MEATTAARRDVSREKARAGAIHLDATVPGWAGRIDVDRLDLNSSADDIPGQLFGDYLSGIEAVRPGSLFRPSHDPERPPILTTEAILWTCEHGFNSFSSSLLRVHSTYEGLKLAWIDEVKARAGQ